jgi:hypothetical protein
LDPDDEQERRRRYNIGALAQSYAPRGLADVLNLSAEGRARARIQWRARPRWERILLFVVIGVELVCLGVLFWGLARGDGRIVLAGAGGLIALMLTTIAVAMVTETRRARTGRRSEQR